jgi:hypothetical protein
MSSRSVRILLLLGAFGVVLAAAFVLFSAERRLSARQSSHTTFEAQARAVTDAIARLSAAQQAYVAEGQSTAYWTAQSAQQLSAARQGLTEMGGRSSSDEARASVEAAAVSLEQFGTLDRRARQFVDNDQRLLASDVIFTESARPLGQAASQVAAAAESERAAATAEIAALRSRQLYAAAGAAGVLLLVVMLLAPVPEADVDVLTAMRALTESPALRPPAVAPSAARPPRPEPVYGDEASSARLLPRAPAPQAAAPPPPPPQAPPAGPALPAVDLTHASQVCSEMARVVDAGGVTGILGKTAGVLEARGVIVWVADSAGTALYPMFAHGYPPAVLLRLGTLPADADNATAAAWRSGELVAIPAVNGAHGALVSPIVTAEGCVGVLAAELEHGAEMRDDIRALATIFSAQLATVVTPVDAVGESGLADRVAT